MRFRGYCALVVVCMALFLSDLVQRFVVSPWVKLLPHQRIPVLGRWIKLMATVTTRPLARIGGASIPVPLPIVPTGPGTLIIMNHQSLFDIPLVVQTVDGGYPRIVTRARYKRFIPLISHMVRLYQYPLVDPTANADDMRKSIEMMGAAGRTSDVPIAIFPEGTRSKNGDIAKFKTAGLRKLFTERQWTVYVFVADGFWRVAKFKDFMNGMAGVRGRMAHVGTLQWTDPTADPRTFIDEIRGLMVNGLAELRQGR